MIKITKSLSKILTCGLNKIQSDRGLKRLPACIALASALVVSPALQAKEDIVLGHAVSQEHIFNPVAERFMASLEKQLPAAFNIKYHPGGDLGDWTSQFEQTIAGEIQMTLTFHATDFDPRLNIATMGMIADDWEGARNIYGPGGSMVAVYDEIYRDLNMKLLAIVPVDFGGIGIRTGVGKVPVNYPEDGKGIKVRVPPTQVGIKRFEALGFSAVPMPFSELYTALQLGAVDGRTFGPPAEIWQMRDVLETYVFSRDYFEQGAMVVNLDWWNDQDDATRAALQASADSAVAWAWQEAENISQNTLAKIRDKGINVVELTAAQQQKLREIIQQKEWSWMEETVGKSLIRKVRDASAQH